MNFQLFIPTRLIFGSGKLKELSQQNMPGKKALLLISNGKSTKANGSFEQTVTQLKKANIEISVFNGIGQNPVKDSIMEGAQFAKENNCDFIVALGGGAVLDASKAIAFMATNDGDLWDYVNGGTGKNQQMKEAPLPIITIATTSGTGSEINNWGVISNPETNEKIGFGGMPELFPVFAIVDPELMKSIPAKFTAYQGFDALFHNTEVTMSNGINIMSELIALDAIKNIAQYLPRVVKDGNDLKAREYVAYASTMAAISMQLTSATSEHAMEHAMSAYHHELAHGAGLIMISNAYYKFFIEKHVCDAQFIKMAKAMGMDTADKPEDFLTMLEKLQKECGVADLKMSDFGFKKDESMDLAKNAMYTMGGLFLADPYTMSVEECANIFDTSFR